MTTPWNWDWHNRAACRDMPLAAFFPPEGERGPMRAAREVAAKAACGRCDVRAECLEYALGRPEKYGTYGGMTEDEREAERRRRTRRAAAAARRAEAVAL